MVKWNCTICNRFAAQHFLAVLRHIGQVHQFEPNFQVKCGLDGCPLRYTSYPSYRSHVYRKHRNVLMEGGASDLELEHEHPPVAMDSQE